MIQVQTLGGVVHQEGWRRVVRAQQELEVTRGSRSTRGGTIERSGRSAWPAPRTWDPQR